jgi:hypothetical protein
MKCGVRCCCRAPALSRYETYVRIVVDDPAALTGAEAVFTATPPRGWNLTNRDESRERRGPGDLGHSAAARLLRERARRIREGGDVDPAS